MTMVKVFIASEAGRWANIAYESLRQVVMIAGWQTERTFNPREATLTYGGPTSSSRSVPCSPVQAWEALQAAVPVDCGGLIVPDCCLLQRVGQPIIDPVICAHFFLCGIYEKLPGMTDPTGIPGRTAAGWGVTEQAAVQHCSEQIAALLNRDPTVGPPAPAWPRGKTWALALTHDCDQPFRYRPKAFLREAITHLRRKQLRPAGVSLLKSVYSTIRSATRDPHWSGWQQWIDTEQALGIKSAYYVATRNRFSTGSDPRDVPYSATERTIRHQVARLHDQGWEVGLHASYNAWSDSSLLEQEVSWFWEYFGFLPEGVRSHFWSLGTTCREEALAMFAQFGSFRYDSSLGLDVIHGFRRGACYPYRPYQADSGRSTQLWELPPTVMDWGLYSAAGSHSARMEKLRTTIATTRRHRGVITLDWHEYTLGPDVMDGLALQLVAELRLLVTDPSCWIASPREIIAWCNEGRWTQNA